MCNRIHYYSVILAGGIGSRFWPISKVSKPKQFLDFGSGGKSFLRSTYDRMKMVVPEENIIIVTLKRYRDMVRRQIPEIDERNILVEEYNRNTAPAITYATCHILKRDPEAVMVCTPADHVIRGKEAFTDTLTRAIDYAYDHEALIAIGVNPTRPDPNFGYIQAVGDKSPGQVIKVKTFTEKPDTELAQVFIDSGEFLWNTGIYVWRASVIRSELELLAPEIAKLWNGWENVLGTADEDAFVQKIYASDYPRISVDYAVMEKTDKAWVFPAEFSWADIGNWSSLYEYLSSHDVSGNSTHITGKAMLKDCRDNVIYSTQNGKLTAIRGLENHMVIDTEDVLLICPRDEALLKEFLSALALPEYEEYR